MAEKAFLAIDMGASSGRHVVGSFDGRKLVLEEVYRFPNGPVEVLDKLYWDVLGQWQHIRNGLTAAGTKYGEKIVSVGVDTWGVDYALLDAAGELLGNPRHYRDPRTDGMLEKAFSIVPKEEIFRHTGIQFLQLNTLYQLLAMKLENSPQLAAADKLLMIPDVFHWMLTGNACNEYTEATTSQFFNPVENRWATELLEQFGLPTSILGEVVPPGTNLGKLRPSVAESTRLSAAEVVLPGSHDTASAVAAVPADSKPGEIPDWCYISLGTWALMGVESPKPVVTDKALELNFTNEGGVGNTIRLLKNITGLWLVQECRRVWNEAGNDWDWEDLNRMTASAPSLVSFINPDARDFLTPSNMPETIREFTKRTGQQVPDSEGAVLRCALDSIAFRFREVLEMCESLIGKRIERIHIVGGGTKNKLLCQAAADACGRPVAAGPVEATAIGNLMVQALAAGEVSSIAEARQVVRESFPLDEYEPQNTAAWDDAYERYLTVCRQS